MYEKIIIGMPYKCICGHNSITIKRNDRNVKCKKCKVRYNIVYGVHGEFGIMLRINKPYRTSKPYLKRTVLQW